MTNPVSDLPAPPVIPSGQEIYDSIMGKIEPELVSAVIPTLEEKYKNETEKEKKSRLDRYNKAFAAYDKAYATYMTDMKERIKKYKHDAMKGLEARNRNQETSDLSHLEESINSLP